MPSSDQRVLFLDPSEKTSPIARLRERRAVPLERPVRRSRAEAVALVLCLVIMTLALFISLWFALSSPPATDDAALRQSVLAKAGGAPVCPDGWAGDHALRLGISEAEVTAWYLQDALMLPDAAVIAGVGAHFARADRPRPGAANVVTQDQILLCVAESRRLLTNDRDRVPPEIRG